MRGEVGGEVGVRLGERREGGERRGEGERHGGRGKPGRSGTALPVQSQSLAQGKRQVAGLGLCLGFGVLAWIWGCRLDLGSWPGFEVLGWM